jgi:hypothetical protein
MAKRPAVKPSDRQMDVRIFLASIVAGESDEIARQRAGISERRISRWCAFHRFAGRIRAARGRATRAKKNHDDRPMIELLSALNDRTQQQVADKYAGGDTERLYQMWISGELLAIWDIELIEGVRKHDPVMAEEYDGRRLRRLEIEGVKPVDYAGELLRRIGLE